MNLLSLSLCNPCRLILTWLRCMGASARESRVSVAIYSLVVVGRPGLHQSGLTSLCVVGCFSPGPRKNDLTIYWALGPFVRSFTLLVDPGDICPPQFTTLKLVCLTCSSQLPLGVLLRSHTKQALKGKWTLSHFYICIGV